MDAETKDAIKTFYGPLAGILVVVLIVSILVTGGKAVKSGPSEPTYRVVVALPGVEAPAQFEHATSVFATGVTVTLTDKEGRRITFGNVPYAVMQEDKDEKRSRSFGSADIEADATLR